MISKPGRVLVTGATGLAGSHTVRALLNAGHEVRAFVRNPDKARRVFEGQEGPLDTVQGDISDLASVRAFIQDFVPLTSGGIQFIDARDLALAHVRMLEAQPGPARYLAAGTFLRWAEVAKMLEVATGKPPRKIPFPAPLLRAIGWSLDQLRRVMCIELPLTAEAAAYITKWHPVPNSQAFDAMGVNFRDISESLQDTVDWLRETGRV